jgi:hypothetical protein
LILAGRAEEEGRDQSLGGRQDLGRGAGEDERGHQRVPGVGQAQGGVILHLGVGVLQGLAQRLDVVRQRDPRQGLGRQFADRAVLALEQGHQRREGARVAEFGESLQG